MAIVSLPLDLDTQKGLQVFLQAIDDPATRANLRAASVPPGATQLIRMIDDPLVQQTAVDLGKRVLKYHHDVAIEATPADPAFAAKIEADGANLKQELENKYPEGMALIANYAKMQQLANRPVRFDQIYTNTQIMVNARVGGTGVGAVTNVALHAEAVTNAAAVANVAAMSEVTVLSMAAVVVFVVVI